MLEKYEYINNAYLDRNVNDRVKNLFLSNKQLKRYEHICSVAEYIDKLALQYGLDREKCCIAALLHDISTLIKWEDMLSYARDNGWQLCEAEKTQPFLLHQRISEVIAREDFRIDDEDILDAIAYHTSLCDNASQYQMALFVADKLAWSPGGTPPYYERMIEAAGVSLERACYEYVMYMELEGNMPSVHDDWTRAVIWLKNRFE